MASWRPAVPFLLRSRYLSPSTHSFRAPNASYPTPTSPIWPGICRDRRVAGSRELGFSGISFPLLCVRSFCVSSNLVEYSAELDVINTKFGEAREEIEMAMESKDTVYFDEEASSARVAVKEVLDRYKGLLARLSEAEKGAVQRSMGLKMEQLKAELERLND